MGLDLTGKIFLQFHEAFGSVSEMKKFVDEHSSKKYSIFDFDLSDPNDPMYMKNMMLAVLGVVKTEGSSTKISAGGTRTFFMTI